MSADRLAALERENADLRRLLRRAAGVLRDVERTQDVASACLRGLEEALENTPFAFAKNAGDLGVSAKEIPGIALESPEVRDRGAATPIQPSTLELEAGDGVESQRAFDARIAAVLDVPGSLGHTPTLPPRMVPRYEVEPPIGAGASATLAHRANCQDPSCWCKPP